MTLPSRLPRSLVLGFVFPVIVLNLWVFSGLYRAFEGVLSTFILAGVIALILNIPVRLLQKRLGFKRSWAIAEMFLLFSVGVILASATLVPMLVIAFFRLVQRLPEWIDSSGGELVDLSGRANAVGLPFDSATIIDGVANNIKEQLESVLLGIPSFVSGSLGGFFSIFFLFVLTVFFLIYGGELVRNCLVSWLPDDRGLYVLGVLRRNFNSYIFNQLVLTVVLITALTPALMLLGAPFPILSGFAIGLMGFIPFGAILAILVVSILFMFKSFWLGLRVFSVLILVDQVIENILPPRLLGKLTGLNPIVILFSVMVGATLADFYGVITAVPIAATIKALFLVPTPLATTGSGTNPDIPADGMEMGASS